MKEWVIDGFEVLEEYLQSLFLRIESFFLKILLSNPHFSKVHERTSHFKVIQISIQSEIHKYMLKLRPKPNCVAFLL